MKIYIILILILLINAFDETQDAYNVGTCICITNKNPSIEINNKLLSKCVEATKIDGTLDSSIYNNYNEPYKTIFTNAQLLLPFSCYNITYPINSNYDQARQTVYKNALKRQYPVAIYKVFNDFEIGNALTILNKIDYLGDRFLITVKSAGHDYEGFSSANKTFVFDISEMFNISVNINAMTATVEAGFTNIHLYTILNTYNVVPISGFSPNIGSGVNQLGLGPENRERGFASDNVISIKIAKPNGNIIIASKTENKNLFFAAIGGSRGGNFGIIISYLIKVYPQTIGVTFAYAWVNNPIIFAQVAEVYQNVTNSPDTPLKITAIIQHKSFVPVSIFGGYCNASLIVCTPIINLYTSKFPIEVFQIVLLEAPFYPGWLNVLSGCNPGSLFQLLNGKWACIDPLDSISFVENIDFIFKKAVTNQDMFNISSIIAEVTAEGRTDDFVATTWAPVNGFTNTIAKDETAYPYRNSNEFGGIFFGSTNKTRLYELVARYKKRFLEICEPYVIVDGIYTKFVSTPFPIENYDKEDFCISYNRENCNKLKIIKSAVDPNNVFNYRESIPLDD
jgi:hypothetical protein